MDVLRNKKVKDIKRLSRYSGVPYYYHSLDNKYTMGTSHNLNPNNIYTVYTVARGDSLDSISLKFYGSADSYWIIANFNNIINPFEHPKIGSTLKIPNISTLEFI